MPASEEKALEISNKDRLKIRGAFFLPEGKAPFPAVVFFHGFTGTYRTGKNLEILKSIASAGLLGIGFDFTHEANSSSEGDFFNLDLNSEISDAEIILDFVKKQDFVDKDRIGVCGHSLGGVIAVILASGREDIKSVGLLSVPWDPKSELPSLLGTTEKKWEDDGYATFPADWEVGNKKIGYNFYKSLGIYNAADLVPNITAPVLVLHGKADDVVSPEKAQKYFSGVASKKKMVFIENGDHVFSDPESLKETCNSVSRWFAQTL